MIYGDKSVYLININTAEIGEGCFSQEQSQSDPKITLMRSFPASTGWKQSSLKTDPLRTPNMEKQTRQTVPQAADSQKKGTTIQLVEACL